MLLEQGFPLIGSQTVLFLIVPRFEVPFSVNKLLRITSVFVSSSSCCVGALSLFFVRVSGPSLCMRRQCVWLWQAACGLSVLSLSS